MWSISLTPGWLGFGKTPVSYIPMWVGLVKGNITFPLPPARSSGQLFSNVYNENWVGLQEVRLRKVWDPLRLSLLEFLTLKLIFSESPAICQ